MKRRHLLLKLDPKKACDKVDWIYLEANLELKSFGPG